MKTKKGRLIMFGIFVFLVALVIVLFVVYRKTAMLRQRMSNIEYFSVIQINRHEDDFEVTIDDMQSIERLYNIINSTTTRRILFPGDHGMVVPDPSWVIRVHYQNGLDDEIFVVWGGLFYRWVSTNGRSVRGHNEALPNFIQDIFDEQGFNEIPRFRETRISSGRWHYAERIHTSNNDFIYFTGTEVHTYEDAIIVANTILEVERNDEILMEHSGNFDLYRRDFFSGFELVLLEHDKNTGIWIFSFWVDDIGVFSNSLRVAFNGNTGEIIQMWIE